MISIKYDAPLADCTCAGPHRSIYTLSSTLVFWCLLSLKGCKVCLPNMQSSHLFLMSSSPEIFSPSTNALVAISQRVSVPTCPSQQCQMSKLTAHHLTWVAYTVCFNSLSLTMYSWPLFSAVIANRPSLVVIQAPSVMNHPSRHLTSHNG